MSASTIEQAIAALEAGEPVVFPTDTVYGLGVAVRHADSPQAVRDIKERAAGKPIAWLVGSVEGLATYGADVPDRAFELARAYWPGPLTIVVKASDAVPPAFQSAEGTIGLRMPDNADALALIEAVGPIAASSANLSGGPDPRAFQDLDQALLERAAVAFEGSQPGSGVASTVIDCSEGKTTVLRQGGIMSDDIYIAKVDYISHDVKTNVNAQMWTTAKFGDLDNPGAEKPKAVIQIVHGMAEYIDRYDDFARYLVGRGFVVCAEDHVGHGGSVESAEEYGHIPAHGGKDIVVGDVHTLHRIMARAFEDVPYVLYGHSMGSFIARAYIARYGDELAACVLSGTGNVAANLSKFGNTLARLLASINGETYRSKFIDNMGAGGYGKKIPNARTELDWLSTDPAVVDAYIADDKCGFMFTVGGYATLLDLTAEVVTPDHAEKVPKELPILLVAGDGDPVGDMGAGVKAAAQLYRDAGVEQVEDKLYEGMRHEIHNEIGHEQVYDDIATWIEAHVQ